MKSLLGILLLLMLAVRIWNGPDEAASASAQRWAEPWSNSAPDAENAWLALVGLGAADGEDPIAFGRRRIDAYEERLRRGPWNGRDAALKALLQDPLPVPPDAYGTRFVIGGCPRRDVDCIDWAGRLLGQFEAIEAASALRLQRYDAALALPRFEESMTPSLIELQPGYGGSTPVLHLDLIARDIAIGASPADALDRLLRVAAFWRRAGEQGRSATIKLLSLSNLERCWRIAERLSERIDARALRALQPRFASLLATPSAAHRDLSPELRYRSQSMERALREQFHPGHIAHECVATGVGRCLGSLLMSRAYSPQATHNLIAATSDELDRLQSASPETYAAALEQFGKSMLRLHPVLDGDFLHPFVQRNPTGRILAATTVPDAQWIERRNDIEVLRRMLAIKVDARMKSVAHDAMPAFLAAQPAALRDPYTGEAFAWDAALQEISFVPDSSYWMRSRFVVSLHHPVPDGIHDCTDPVRVRFRRRMSESETTDLAEALGCGRVGDIEVTPPAGVEESESEPMMMHESFHDVLIAADDTAAQIRLAWRGPDERLLGYEHRDLPLDGQFRIMQDLGHDDGALLEVSATPARDVSLVRIHLRNQSVGRLARDLQRVKKIELGTLPDACRAQRFTAGFSAIPVEELLWLLADTCNRYLHVSGPGTYRFETFPPADAG